MSQKNCAGVRLYITDTEVYSPGRTVMACCVCPDRPAALMITPYARDCASQHKHINLNVHTRMILLSR